MAVGSGERPRHVLILGGTTEARRLAAELARRADLRVTSSLAGRVAEPRLPVGEVRIGGFGGPAGLAEWLRTHRVDALVDATHPFAEVMSRNAARAAADTGVPLLALRRPGWTPAEGDRWHRVASLAEAADALPALGRRIFLTTGRLGLAAFAHLTDLDFLARSVDAPQPPLPRRTEILLDRGPFTLEGSAPCFARTGSRCWSPRTAAGRPPPPSSARPASSACRSSSSAAPSPLGCAGGRGRAGRRGVAGRPLKQGRVPLPGLPVRGGAAGAGQ